MSDYRLSIGQYSGYYNINDRDYQQFDGGCNPVLQERRNIPDLTIREITQVERAVHNCLAGWTFIPDKEIVDYRWPSPSFGFDSEYVDRTMNVWVATCRYVESNLLSRLSQLLRDDFPLWRIVIRMPRGDNADCTIYPDAIRVGDDFLESEDELNFRKSHWQQAESQDLAPRAHQISVLSGASPKVFLDKNQDVFQLAVVPGAFGFDAKKSVARTAWFGYRCHNPDDAPHRIQKLIMGGIEIVAGATEIPGCVSTRLGWSLSPRSKANSMLVYFRLDRAIRGGSYQLSGYSTADFREWRYPGVLAE